MYIPSLQREFGIYEELSVTRYETVSKYTLEGLRGSSCRTVEVSGLRDEQHRPVALTCFQQFDIP